jgi:hypothetical protein
MYNLLIYLHKKNMVNSFETNFIPQAVEKTPFANTPAQNFFGKWCRINDSIIPHFISREEWEQRGIRGIPEKSIVNIETDEKKYKKW